MALGVYTSCTGGARGCTGGSAGPRVSSVMLDAVVVVVKEELVVHHWPY